MPAVEIAPEERIASELLSRLQTAVFDGKPVAVFRPNRDASEVVLRHGAIVLAQGETERVPELDCPGNPAAIAYQIGFSVLCYVRLDDRSRKSDTAAANQFSAVARKAVCDSADWHVFDDVSFDAEVTQTDIFSADGEGAFSGATFGLVMRYRVSETDPFEVRS